MIEIVPSILTDNPAEFRDLVAKSEKAAKRVHVDIIDGVYADNQTIEPTVLEDIGTNLLIDFHLMVDEPVNWIEKCVRASADRIVGHIEMMSDRREFIAKVVEAGINPGLAIDIDSYPKELGLDVYSSLEIVIVMSVSAGFGGQKFNVQALDKIKYLSKIRKDHELSFLIADDGGITFENVDDLAEAGVDEVIIGRRLFEGDIGKNIANYQKQATI